MPNRARVSRTSRGARMVDAGLGLGDVERELQAAQLVDQAGLLGVVAGEDAAAGRRIEPGAVELARFADLAREFGVDRVEFARYGGALRRRGRLERRVHPGI